MCILDTNLLMETIEALVSCHSGTAFFLDPVSTAKALKTKKIIGAFHTIKPNKMEAEILSGINIETEEDLKRAGAYFIAQGVKQIL